MTRQQILTRVRGGGGSPSQAGGGGALVDEALVWGTMVNVKKTMDSFRLFVREFKKHHEVIAGRVAERKSLEAKHAEATAGVADGDAAPFTVPAALAEELDDDFLRHEDQPFYIELLRNAIDNGERFVSTRAENINIQNIAVNAAHLSICLGDAFVNDLCTYPSEIVPMMDVVLGEFKDDLERSRRAAEGGDLDDVVIQVRSRVWNLPTTHQMRMLDPSHIDRLVSLRGMVVRMSAILPEMRTAFYRCGVCGASKEVDVERGRVEDPAACDGCAIRGAMELVHNRSRFIDKQQVKLQEAPENVPEGETPSQIQLFVFDEMVDAVVPGDRVVVTGVFRALGRRLNPRISTIHSIYTTVVDVIHFSKDDKEKMASMEADKTSGEYAPKITVLSTTEKDAEVRARVEAMRAAHASDVTGAATYTALAASLAPSIWELDDVKKGVLLMLFGGLNKDLGSNGKIRGEINVLLCGDPGTAKSQLLSYVHRISPRGMYTSGTGSSAVGLTAYITKDPDNRNEFVLESGALVLSDRGVCW